MGGRPTQLSRDLPGFLGLPTNRARSPSNQGRESGYGSLLAFPSKLTETADVRGSGTRGAGSIPGVCMTAQGTNPDPVAAIHARFAAAAEAKGFCPEIIGRIASDPLLIWTRPSKTAEAPVVLLSAGIHGDERCGPEALLNLFEEQTFCREIRWVAAPLLNPAGYRLGSRENGEGIDLNRDFLRRRALETRCFMDWWLGQPTPCDLHLSLHEDWEAEGFYLYEINTSLRVSIAAEILAQLAGKVELQQSGPVDGHELAAPGLILHEPVPDEPEGWPEAIWITRTWPVQSYTFEAPGRFSPRERGRALRLAAAAAMQVTERLLR